MKETSKIENEIYGLIVKSGKNYKLSKVGENNILYELVEGYFILRVISRDLKEIKEYLKGER